MRHESDDTHPENTLGRGFCLTELSVAALVGGALGLSLFLWLIILTVL